MFNCGSLFSKWIHRGLRFQMFNCGSLFWKWIHRGLRFQMISKWILRGLRFQMFNCGSLFSKWIHIGLRYQMILKWIHIGLRFQIFNCGLLYSKWIHRGLHFQMISKWIHIWLLIFSDGWLALWSEQYAIDMMWYLLLSNKYFGTSYRTDGAIKYNLHAEYQRYRCICYPRRTHCEGYKKMEVPRSWSDWNAPGRSHPTFIFLLMG